MSRFKVDWQPTAEDDLADIWLSAPDPQAVNGATNAIDRLLAADPIRNGRHLA